MQGEMSERVRHLVGLENILMKARRRFRECQREIPGTPRAERYGALITSLSKEVHGADQTQLTEYLEYMEGSLLPRISDHVDEVKGEMVRAAIGVVTAKGTLYELRAQFTEALDRIRSVRERLGRDPFKPHEANFGLGVHPPNAPRHVRDAHNLAKDYLKSS